jgi:hypothetical protein
MHNGKVTGIPYHGKNTVHTPINLIKSKKMISEEKKSAADQINPPLQLEKLTKKTTDILPYNHFSFANLTPSVILG